MNESPVRKFCESSHRKLIVAIVTTLVGLAVLVPLADDYFDKKVSRETLAEELDRAQQTVKTLPAYEQRVAELSEEVDQFEARSVSQQSISEYRSKLVELIQDSGCQVRRLDVSAPTLRPWLENGNPLKKPVANGVVTKETPFTLERLTIGLVVDGTMDNIHGLLERLHMDESFAYPRRLHLNAEGPHGGSVEVELELWLFALSRNTST